MSISALPFLTSRLNTSSDIYINDTYMVGTCNAARQRRRQTTAWTGMAAEVGTRIGYAHAMATLRLGIDLGGTKIEGIALAGSDERARLRIDTPRDDYHATIEAIASMVAALERQCGGPGPVGVGIPGAPAPGTGLVKNANSVWLIGRPLARDL